MPYVSEVKQISTLTVNDKSINKTDCDVTDRDDLIPLSNSELNEVLISPTLNYVAPILLDESGRPYVQGLLNGRKIKWLIDLGAELSLTNHKLPVKANAPKSHLTGFNGKENAVATKVFNVNFEIPGFLKTNIDIWCCQGAGNILGMDVISKLNWIIDFSNSTIWKDSSRPKSMLLDLSMCRDVGSVCTAIADRSSDYNWPHTGTNLELEQLVRSHKDLWSQTRNETGLLKDIEIDIEGRDPKPQIQCKLPQESIGPLSNIIQEFLQQGILKKAQSVVNNCVWPIKNADDSYSLSVDLRSLNKCITTYKPLVPDLKLMSHLNAKAKVFSVLEVSNSHFSVPLAKSCQYKLAFSFNKETYAFTRVIPGLDISDGIVHECLGKILSKFSRPECIFQHVDKFLLSTKSIEEHITLLSELFTLLQTAGLKLNTEMVQLMKSQVAFFHMQIGHGQRQLLQEKVGTISAIPVPKTRQGLHDFLSEINDCKEFLHRYNDKVKPLLELLRQKDVVFDQWGQAQKDAFEKLKREVQNAPSLNTVEFDSSFPFVLQTDVSENSISVILSQLKGDDQKIIGFFSRGLTKLEKTFDAHIKELLSVYFAVKVTENIVRSSKIILQTSDPSLKLLLEKINSGELCDRFSPIFKTLYSKPIQVDVVTEHFQQCVQTDVCTNSSRKLVNGIFRTSVERDIELGFVEVKKCSAGRPMWFSFNGNAIQQKVYRKC